MKSRFAFKCCWFFAPCPPRWLPFRSILVPFWLHFGGTWAPFCITLGCFVFHLVSLQGSSEEGCFSIHFWKPKMVAKWSPRGSQNPLRIGAEIIVFVDPFLGAFWYLLIPLSEGHGGPPEGNLHGHVFGHTVRPHLVARCLEAQLEFRFAFKFGSFC